LLVFALPFKSRLKRSAQAVREFADFGGDLAEGGQAGRREIAKPFRDESLGLELRVFTERDDHAADVSGQAVT